MMTPAILSVIRPPILALLSIRSITPSHRNFLAPQHKTANLCSNSTIITIQRLTHHQLWARFIYVIGPNISNLLYLIIAHCPPYATVKGHSDSNLAKVQLHQKKKHFKVCLTFALRVGTQIRVSYKSFVKQLS